MRTKPQPHQKLWVVRWGTQTAMVWAGNAEVAEAKVRRRAYEPALTWPQIHSYPVRVDGPMCVREATDEDTALWHECNGRDFGERSA